FPIATTPVTCTATDSHGNTGSASFHVTVNQTPDTTAPVITVPADLTVEATSAAGAVVSYSASATDPDDAVSSFRCAPASGSSFGSATTTVTCTATDSHANSATKSFNVTVHDTTKPVVTPPPNQRADATSPSGVAVTYPNATATDNIDGPLTAPCSPASG